MPGQRIGYVRVSTLEQNTDRQLDGVVVERCFTDRASGKDTRRPELEAMTRFVREGDTLVVHSMDRLARNLDDLRRIVKTLTERRVCIQAATRTVRVRNQCRSVRSKKAAILSNAA